MSNPYDEDDDELPLSGDAIEFLQGLARDHECNRLTTDGYCRRRDAEGFWTLREFGLLETRITTPGCIIATDFARVRLSDFGWSMLGRGLVNVDGET